MSGSERIHQPYTITWWYNMSDERTAKVAYANTFEEVLHLLPRGPYGRTGWQRYRIMQGDRFVERGDPIGPRGAPADERFC